MRTRTFNSPETWLDSGLWLRGIDFYDTITIGNGTGSGQGIIGCHQMYER
jgi:hypothetical protein